jgi:aryl-alcohol dehydrogenase-like predicted oxidoreductase
VDGLVTAELVLGSAQWGMGYGIANTTGQPSANDLRRMLDAAHAKGVRWLDTARAYGSSEDRIGELAAPTWRIATKVAPEVASAEAVATSVSASRAALRRERLDVVLFHRSAHRHVERGLLWKALLEEKSSGRVARVGVSVDRAMDAMELVEDPEIEALQVPGSLLDQRLWRGGFFERARERGIVVFVRSIFLQGAALLDPNALPPHLAALRAPLSSLHSRARDEGLSPAALFLGFARSAFGCFLVAGFEKFDQLEEALVAWDCGELAAARSYADLVPPLDDDVLDPARWPRT